MGSYDLIWFDTPNSYFTKIINDICDCFRSSYQVISHDVESSLSSNDKDMAKKEQVLFRSLVLLFSLERSNYF